MVLSVLLLVAGSALLQIGSGGFLWWAVAFFVLAIVAAAMGYGGIAGVTMDIAKWLVILFVILALLALIL